MQTRTVVVKVGSNTLVDEAGEVRRAVVRDILLSLKDAALRGERAALITSGAVKLGRLAARDANLSRSASASIGQPLLWRSFAREAEEFDIRLSEFLLDRPSLVLRERFLHLKQTFQELFDRAVIPVINENDALVADTSWSFGDNDSLAAALAIALQADELVIVTHIDGLFDGDPLKDQSAKLIPVVSHVNEELLRICSADSSIGGRGGMLSKLKAARICTAVGIETRIVNGLVPGNLTRALKKEPVGTTLTASSFKKTLTARDRWLLAAKNSAGSVAIDDGAASALMNGKSLLAVGVRGVYGKFEAKEIIEVVDPNRRGIAFGIIDYSKKEIENMLRTNDAAGKMLIHANNMVVFK